jgi:uncharacterized protein (TIGR02246 family)
MRPLAAAALLLCACRVPPPTTTDEATTLRDSWLSSFNGRQLEPTLSLYTDDAVFLPPTGNRIAGSAALRTLYTQAFAARTVHLTLTSAQLTRHGDLAYDSGDYRESVDANGEHSELSGGYVFVYRHTDAGWRLAAQSWSEAPR